MARIALVAASGRVVNVIVAGDDYTAPEGLSAVPDNVGAAEPGGTWDGAVFAPYVPPPPPAPPSKAELLSRIAALEAQVAALPD